MSDENTLRDDVVAAADAVTGDTPDTYTDIDPDDADIQAVDIPDADTVEPGDDSPQLAVETAQEPPIEALQHWPYQFREQFNKLGEMEGGRAYQEAIVENFKGFQRREMDHVRELDAYKQQQQQIDSLLAPFDAQFAMAGMDRMGGVRQLLGWAQVLSQDPGQGLQMLARSYGLDLGELAKEAPYVDPATRQYQQQTNQQLQTLRGELAQRDAVGRQQFQNQLMQQVAAFEAATNEDGSPRYPHVEQVYNQVAQACQPYIAQQQMPPLEQLYEQAVFNNPTLRQGVIDSQVQAELDRRNAAAKRARAAGTQVKGNAGGGKTKHPARNLRQDVEAAADAVFAAQGRD